ncbi:hypothetical protein D3C71_1715890 [compost metagenome]
MNVEIQNVGLTIAFVYLIIQLFRYIDWLFNSYILVLGAEVKLPFVLDCFSLLYFVMLFVFINKLPDNPVLLILLVGGDSIIKTIINSVYFKSKKWMKNITEVHN